MNGVPLGRLGSVVAESPDPATWADRRSPYPDRETLGSRAWHGQETGHSRRLLRKCEDKRNEGRRAGTATPPRGSQPAPVTKR